MLHTKFHRYQSTGCLVEFFLGLFNIYGCGRHLGHVTKIPQTLGPPTHRGFKQNLALISQAVYEKMFEILDNDDDNGQLIMGIL